MTKAKGVVRPPGLIKMTNEDRKAYGLPLRGKPVVPVPEGFRILSNGLYEHQWNWLMREAALREPRMDGAQLQRQAVQWYIDAVESGRNSVVATPEQDEDFEKLIRTKNKSVKAKNKSKQIKPRSN